MLNWGTRARTPMSWTKTTRTSQLSYPPSGRLNLATRGGSRVTARRVAARCFRLAEPRCGHKSVTGRSIRAECGLTGEVPPKAGPLRMICAVSGVGVGTRRHNSLRVAAALASDR